ncbi:efflux RND transporter permease subunit [Paraburkholderia humisilvae]|uniref:Efflux pump membrane transporter BepE n=1 Tax=Paraburkholderia humisilvae TaxID=627669 RepID=A0A6J5EJE4_9BURK|nr:efflux RND transporter permease subunit [Paraburkholderia humisilvae]CAB3765874.1 Efflux pump membrane transporter BepE [Paraburkholderia humisilvae]
MNFTDIFIRRPVLASALSLLILALGVRALLTLRVSEYPQTENAVVTVTTVYYGAPANTVAGFITQPLEAAIGQAQGIDYLSSTSRTGVSTIVATLRLNYDSTRALSQINTQIQSVRNQLPPQAQPPTVAVQVGQTTDAMYLGFYSDVLPGNGITDYLLRVIKPKLDAIEGVQTTEMLGDRQFALRAWLDSDRLAAHNLTATDVYNALASNNYLATLGTTKGRMVSVDLNAGTDLHSVDEFRKLVIKQQDGALIRLEDVADVVLGADNYDSSVSFGGKRSVFLGVKVAPGANALDVAKRVRDVFPQLQQQLPTGLTGTIVYDATDFIDVSINEVMKTLVEAFVIVTLVTFLFLGNLRAVIVPVIAMPLSLFGTFFLMQLLGYTLNLLTLLALVLAIGLVVDDAIIIVENVDRQIKERGLSPVEASIVASRQLGGPIIAMTVVLIAAYIPIGLQGGLTGALFTEFAFTLAAAVTVSGVVALTLSPMICARYLRVEGMQGRLPDFINRTMERIGAHYLRMLKKSLDMWPVFIVMGVLMLAGLVYLFNTSMSELAPQEDRGIVLAQVQGPPTATIQQMQGYADQVFALTKTMPEYAQMFQLTGTPTLNSSIGGMLLKPWNQRKKNSNALQQEMQKRWSTVAGARVAAFQLPSLPGSQGLPMQFVIGTTGSIASLNEVAQAVLRKVQASGKFFFVDSDLKIDKPQSTLVVDRDKVALLGLTQDDVGRALSSALGGAYVNYFSIDGRSYKVIPQVRQTDRLNPSQVLDYYVRTPTGGLVPVSTFAHLREEIVPEAINHFQQLNSATISGVPVIGLSQSEVLEFMRKTLAEVAPNGYAVDYAGASRQFMQESGGFTITLLLAILIVYLVLAAQFESYRDPLVILVTVPMALFGAMVLINVGLTTLNIYTEVGLVTLMGLISKHGILIVQYANVLRRAGRSKRGALEEAAHARLRPILMTTAAMALGAVPLVLASGAGASGRNAMGIVIVSGLSIGTLFTLFVLPASYMLVSADRRQARRKVSIESVPAIERH